MKAELVAAMLLLSVPVAAQWLTYKTPGIPRTPDGEPDLSAAVPRTAEGKPDLSGIWRASGGPYNRNIAVDLKPEEIQPWAQEIYWQRVFNLGADSPRALCLPDPPPTYHLNGMARIVQTPALTVIINEGVSNSNTTRMIFTDGRGLPEQMDPTWLGYSVGRWEGDTLVVTTAGFNDRSWLDFDGHPHSEDLRITERFHRRDFGHMDFQMTLEDPKAFTRPISFRADKTLVADTEIMETICENGDTAQHMKGVGLFRMKPEALAKYAGTYQFGSGREAAITVDGPTLILKLGGQTAQTFTLAAESETMFVSTGFGERAEFTKDAGGAITGFTFTTGTGLGLGNRPTSVQKALRKGAAPGAR
jgi:hypothetical protein